MSNIPSLTSKKVISILKHHGFQLDHTTGSHYIFYHPEKKKRVSVAYHAKDIPKGTLHSILNQAGISEKDL